MSRWRLTLRRLWWFFTDMKTYITFRWPCQHCGDEFGLWGRGFFPLRYKPHNPVCKYARWFNEPYHRGWLYCRYCLRKALWNVRFWIVQRWKFRLKYNWGRK